MSQADVMGSRGWIISYVIPPDIETEDDVYYSNRQRIHNAIVQAFSQGTFLLVAYDPDTGEMSVDNENTVSPKTILTNDTSCSFITAEKNRMRRIEERGVWIWQAIIGFDTEVALDAFEENFTNNPILLPRDRDKNLRQVEISLKAGEYIHPPKQQPSSGTQVTYTLEARLGRV